MRAARICLTLVLALAVSAPVHAQRLDADFERLVDSYLAEFFGTGDGPSMRNDGSAAYYENRVAVARSILEAMDEIDRERLTPAQDVDFRYLEGLSRDKVIEGEQVRYWEKDPTLYLRVEPLVTARGGLIYREDRPAAERVDGVLAVLNALPGKLANARDNLEVYIPLWLQPSLNLLDGAVETMEVDVTRFAERVPDRQDEILAARDRALDALESFRTFLEDDWPTRPEGDWRVSKDVYDARIRHRYQIEGLDAEALYQWGREQYAEQLRVLDRAAKKVGDGRSWRQIQRDLQADHPSAETMLNAFHVEVRRSRDWIIDNDLVSIPWDDENAAAAIYTPAYYNKLTFTGFGGAPRARESTFPGAVMLSPIDERWSPAEKERFLASHNYAFITTLMPHEVYPGHGLVALYDNHNPRPLRTYESSYSNQGWCYYVEWILTPEFGFYPPEKQAEYEVEMERLKLWRYARVIYDIGMHLGHVTVDEAVELMTGDVMFAEPYAFLQVQGATHSYARTGVPTLGYHEFMAIRDEYFTQMYLSGKTGRLKDLHDRVLKIGTLPYSLLREELLRQIAAE